MKSAHIFVDNLRIGGYQRLALDEAYELSDLDYDVSIWTLEDSRQAKTFQTIEKTIIREKNISVNLISKSRFRMLISLNRVFSDGTKIDLVISHSLRATLILRILRIKYPITINTKIHQIPRLSDIRQRAKRFVYAQFPNKLFAFSNAATISWYKQFPFGSKILKKYTKEMKTLRNGIYLGRLPRISENKRGNKRVIFLGRLTFWKGMETFKSLALQPELSEFQFVFVVPNYDDETFRPMRELIKERLVIIEGKSFGELVLFEGDVHLYPAQYGSQVPVFESVSINCLEMACVGIPSLVTAGGQMTWTESEFDQIFYEVDWTNLEEIASKIAMLSRKRFTLAEISFFREKISVRNELNAFI